MTEAREMVCVECGCIEGAENMIYADGGYYCENCAEAKLVKCDKCGEYHRADRMYTVVSEGGDEQEWCQSCVEEGARYCDGCDTYYDQSYANFGTVVRGGWNETWCEWCIDDYAITCSDCGTLVSQDDAYWVDSTGEYVCDECLHDNYYECEDCGEYFLPDDMYHDRDWYHHICHRCAETSYYWRYCSICGEYVYEDEYDDDAEACTSCMQVNRRSDNARVRDYSCDDPCLKFFGKYGDVFRGCGIELEIDRREPDGNKKQSCLNKLDELFGEHGYFKHDGSLSYGIEIVTQPHTEEAFYELPWEEILQTCIDHGYSSHEIGTCGLHMHVSRAMFGDDEEEQTDNIAKLMQFYEMYWMDILRVSRRTEQQAERWANRYRQFRKNTLKDYAKNKCASRYMAVNVTNNSTVEIRINRGTLKLSTFLATCDFILTTCKNSKNIEWSDVSDDYLWLKGLKKETYHYLNQRNAFDNPVWKYLEQIRQEEHEQMMAEMRERAEQQSPTDTVEFRQYTAIPVGTASTTHFFNDRFLEIIDSIDEENAPF